MSAHRKPGSSERLTHLVELARREEQEAGAALTEQRSALMNLGQELTLLKQYRVEYAGTSALESHSGLSAMRLQNLQGFIRTLDEAVALKAAQLQAQQDAVERARLNWLERYQRCDALGRVRDGRKKVELLEQDRLDQRIEDELVNSRITDSSTLS